MDSERGCASVCKGLDDAGLIEQIKERNGTLRDLLIEVLMESYRKK